MSKQKPSLFKPESFEVEDVKFYPVTPGGTICDWLESDTEEEAWNALMKDASHMPYNGVEGFKKRGYTVEGF